MCKLFFFLFLFFTSYSWALGGPDTSYHNNGRIKSIYKHDRLLRKARLTNFDTSGVVLSKGKTLFATKLKQGRWRFYKAGKLEKKVAYRYNQLKSSWRTEDGKRIRCYLIGGRGDYSKLCTKSKMRFVSAYGCIPWKIDRIKIGTRNFFFGTRMYFKFGSKWYDKVTKRCETLI